jgi:hypothetical protein
VALAARLDTLTPDQRSLVDLTAEALMLDNEWPIFDYLEGAYDKEQKNAASHNVTAAAWSSSKRRTGVLTFQFGEHVSKRDRAAGCLRVVSLGDRGR